MDVDESALQLLAISRVQPFSYDHGKGEFSFGDEKRTVDEIQQFGSPHTAGEDLTTGDVRDMLQTVPYVHGFRNPIGY